MNAPIEEIKAVAETGYMSWIQLHGDETPQFCDKVRFSNVRTIKAIRVQTEADIQKARDYYTYSVLLDAFSSKRYGGTGKQFNWQWAKNLPKRIFLAGGLRRKMCPRRSVPGFMALISAAGSNRRRAKKTRTKCGGCLTRYDIPQD